MARSPLNDFVRTSSYQIGSLRWQNWTQVDVEPIISESFKVSALKEVAGNDGQSSVLLGAQSNVAFVVQYWWFNSFLAPIKGKCFAAFDVIFIDTFLNKWTSFILKLHRVNPREIPENKESEEFRMGWLLWNIIQRLIAIITSGGLISIDLRRIIASLWSTSFGHTSTWNNLQSSELQLPSTSIKLVVLISLQIAFANSSIFCEKTPSLTKRGHDTLL